MADQVAEIILKARDQASRVIRDVAGEMGGLNKAVQGAAALAGPFGATAAAIGAAATAVVALGDKLAEKVINLEKLSTASGATTQEIQVLQRAFQKMGFEADDVTTPLLRLEVAVGKHNKKLAEMGVTSTDGAQAMLQFSAALSRIQNPAERAALLADVLGKRNIRLSAAVLGVGDAYAATKRRMEETGQILTDDMIARAKELHDTMQDLRDSWEGAWSRMLVAVEPAAKGILDAITSILNVLPELDALPTVIDRAQNPHNIHQDSLAPRIYTPLLPTDMKSIALSEELRKAKAAEEAAKKASTLTVGTPSKAVEELRAAFELSVISAMRLNAAIEAAAEDVKKWKLAGQVISAGPANSYGSGDDVDQIRKAFVQHLIAEIQARDTAEPMTPGLSSGMPSASPFWIPPRAAPNPQLQPGPLAPVTPLHKDPLREILANWTDMAAELTSRAQILNGALSSVYDGLRAGFSSAFASIGQSGTTFLSALSDGFRAFISAIKQQLAELLATEAMKLIIGLITHGGAAVVTGVLSGTGSGPGNVASASPVDPFGGAFGASQAGGNTYVINTISAKDVLGELISPTGTFRRAGDRVRQIAMAAGA